MKGCLKFITAASLLSLFALPALANTSNEGYYGAVRLHRDFQEAKNMDTSNRPGIGSFVPGESNNDYWNSSLAAGYQWGNGWRTEGEYTFNKRTTFTSGSSNFPNGFNNQHSRTQRLMLNVYRDYDVMYGFSVYGTVGLGVAVLKTSGWQGNESRQFSSNSQNNLAYSLGAGVSWTVPMLESLSFDLGYRYVDMGKTESGMNQFENIRKLQDEQLKARLVNDEYTLGVRYLF